MSKGGDGGGEGAEINKSSLDSEKSFSEKFEIELKNVIYGIMFLMLKEDEQSIYIGSFLVLIQFLQTLYFSFQRNLQSAWNSTDVGAGLSKGLEYFYLQTYFQTTDFNTYMIFFYVLISIMALIYLDIFLVSYQIQRKRQSHSMQWPITISFGLFTTVLFLPFLDFFLSMLNCQYDMNNLLVLEFYNNVQCFKGIHILHSILGVIASIFLILMVIIISLINYDCRNNENNPFAKSSGRCNIVLILYQTVMRIFFCFLYGDNSQYLLILVNIIGTVIVFLYFQKENPYFNTLIQKIWSSFTCVLVFTSILLIFAKFLESNDNQFNYFQNIDQLFEGTIYAWIIGVPILLLIIMNNQQKDLKILLFNPSKFENGDQIIQQVKQVKLLIRQYQSSKITSLMLDGFLEVHRNTCNKEDCASKQISEILQQNQANKPLQQKLQEDIYDKQKISIIEQVLKQMFFYGIKKFPLNTNLRINYAFYLLENKKWRQQALQELTHAEQNNPPFDTDFIIYRYKKIIEDEIAEGQNDGNIDIVSEMASQNQLRSMQTNIERCSLSHMEFWSQLSEDNPDLGKLNEIGQKINIQVTKIDEQWGKLKKVSQNIPRASRVINQNEFYYKNQQLYGKFLFEVLNDKKQGEELMSKARNIQNNNQNRRLHIITSNEDISNESHPTIIITTEQDKFGYIIGFNLAACNLFGCLKSDVMFKKINQIMPKIHDTYHDSFLKNILASSEAKFMNKERFVFGKTRKDGYIFPCYINIQPLQSISQGQQYIGSFRIEKNFRKVAYVYTDTTGLIYHISSSAYNILQLEDKFIDQKDNNESQRNIDELVPGLILNHEHYLNKQGEMVNYIPPQFQNDSQELKNKTIHLNLICMPINFQRVPNAGFIFKFEINDQKEELDISQIVQKKKEAMQKLKYFFQFEPELNSSTSDTFLYIGKFYDQANQNYSYLGGDITILANSNIEIDQSKLNINDNQNNVFLQIPNQNQLTDQLRFINTANNNLQNQQINDNSNFGGNIQTADQQQLPKRIDYGIGYKAVRYNNGQIQEIEEIKFGDVEEDDEDQDEDVGNSTLLFQLEQQDANEQEGGNDFSSALKSRNVLQSVVQDQSEPKGVINLRRITNLLIIILISIAFADYFVSQKKFSIINQYINLINLADKRMAQFEVILGNVIDLQFLNIGVYDLNAQQQASGLNFSRSTMETQLKNEISNSLIEIQNLQKSLTFTNIAINPQLDNLLHNNVITIAFNQNNKQKYNLNDAIQQLINYAFQILNVPLNEIQANETNIFFVVNNMFNDFYVALKQSRNFYVMLLQDSCLNQNSLLFVFVIISFVCLIIAIILLFPILIQVNKTREEVLTLFLDIPDNKIKQLYTRCENFISNLQVGEDDEVNSVDQDDNQEAKVDPHNSGYLRKNKRKKYKNSSMSQKSFFISILIGALILEAYFVYNYYLSTNIFNNTNQLIAELNVTYIAESYFTFVDNEQRQYFFNPSYYVLGQNTKIQIQKDIQQMFYIDGLMNQQHSINTEIHESTYNDAFNNILMQDPCQILFSLKAVNVVNCQQFAEGTIQQGMSIAVSRYFEDIRQLNNMYSDFLNNFYLCFQDETGQSGIYKNIYPNDPLRNKVLSLLVTNQAAEIRAMQKSYISFSYRYLMDQMKQSIQNNFNSVEGQRLALIIIFIVFLFVIFTIFWSPYVTKIAKGIQKTRQLLTMIPISVIQNIGTIKAFIKKYLSEHSVSNY